jgi:hypothetical protein
MEEAPESDKESPHSEYANGMNKEQTVVTGNHYAVLETDSNMPINENTIKAV